MPSEKKSAFITERRWRTESGVPLSSAEAFITEALDALQFLDEREGPASVAEYVHVLTAIQAELGERIRTAVENEIG